MPSSMQVFLSSGRMKPFLVLVKCKVILHKDSVEMAFGEAIL